ncbi:MAG: cystathionine beta-synthase [Bdellovibrio sp.]|nr:MAG: cystathionine beta-synthase [Bdellovibrio sp.]
MKRIHESILETIGWTPIVRLKRIAPDSIHQYWAKLEFMNPGGSVKDRIGLHLIVQAEKRGQLKPGGTIIEATSGNTGLGLAMVSAVKGYCCIFVMPDKVSEEKQALLRAYGAQVVITPSALSPEDPGSYQSTALRLHQEIPNSFYADQFHNADNPLTHYQTTGPEIWEQMGGKLDAFVAGAGTGGTLSGAGKFLKEKKPTIKNVLADPMGSILFDLFYQGRPVDPTKPYKVEGVGQAMLPMNIHLDWYDEVLHVNDRDAFQLTRKIVSSEGICVGPSGGMAMAAALEYGQRLSKPANILVLFPDTGRGYLSKVFNDQWMRENELL